MKGIIYCFVQVVTCGSIPLETSFQRTARCVYASTELDEYKGWGGKSANPSHRCFSWGRRHSEVSFAYINDCIYRLIWQIELVLTMLVFYYKCHIFFNTVAKIYLLGSCINISPMRIFVMLPGDCHSIIVLLCRNLNKVIST